MTLMGEMDLMREDLRRASKHLKEAADWAREHPKSTASAVPYLLAGADGAIEALNDANSLIWKIQNALAVASAQEAFTEENKKEVNEDGIQGDAGSQDD